MALARDANVFVCDAATPDDQKLDGRLTPGLAGAYAARAGARCLVPTHFYPVRAGRDLEAMARARYDGRVVLAYDLLRLPVTGA